MLALRKRMALILFLVVASGVLAQGPKEFKPRLPRYYSGIVTEIQRRDIYRIQQRYFEKIADLEMQLKALKAEQEVEMEAVLTISQRERLNKIREAAGVKRK